VLVGPVCRGTARTEPRELDEIEPRRGLAVEHGAAKRWALYGGHVDRLGPEMDDLLKPFVALESVERVAAR
jgi:hypothetical protein